MALRGQTNPAFKRSARELKKFGHDKQLMPPTYFKAYVKRGKNYAANAVVICEAVSRSKHRPAIGGVL